MPTYIFKCKFCTNHTTIVQPISSFLADVQGCSICGELAHRDFRAEGAHVAPVPGTGNWPYAQKLEEKAARIKASGGVHPRSESHIKADQDAFNSKR
jgi:predicted nucleic acid-binding Zn ribbon protein